MLLQVGNGPAERFATLTEREQAVGLLLADGLTNPRSLIGFRSRSRRSSRILSGSGRSTASASGPGSPTTSAITSDHRAVNRLPPVSFLRPRFQQK